MRAGITELVRCTISARPNGSISRQRFLPRHIRDLARHGGRAYMLQTDWLGAITHNMTLERRSAGSLLLGCLIKFPCSWKKFPDRRLEIPCSGA